MYFAASGQADALSDLSQEATTLFNDGTIVDFLFSSCSGRTHIAVSVPRAVVALGPLTAAERHIETPGIERR